MFNTDGRLEEMFSLLFLFTGILELIRLVSLEYSLGGRNPIWVGIAFEFDTLEGMLLEVVVEKLLLRLF